MNNKNLSKCILASFLLFSSAVMAKNTVEVCETTMDTTAEVSRCLDGIKEKKDRELQTWVNNQVFILEESAANNGRRTSLDMFKRSQRNFISYRENNCRWQYLLIAPNAGAPVAYKKCYITLTQYRIEELTNLDK
ncbi:DUF1311 domain-containing protein [Colwellia sp. BRX10-3]|nr:DUF1311 domain-containing protein [Colwellia sp. BRX10-3]